MLLVTCRCGGSLPPTAQVCGRCGARPLVTPSPSSPRVAAPVPPPRGPRPVPTPVLQAAPFARHHAAPNHHAVPHHLVPVEHRAAPGYSAPFPPATARPLPVPAPTAAARPAPRTGSSGLTSGLAIGATILALALVGVVTFLVLRPAQVVVAAPAAVPTPTTKTQVVTVPSPVAGVSGNTYTSTGSTDTEATSAELLREGVAQHRSSVEALAGWWVPQLSAKKVGTVADGMTYGSTDILSHYNGLHSRFPETRLVWSGDWPVFTEDDYWVVVAARPFSTAGEANAWCDAQGFSADDCMAKRLSHSGGPSGSTLPRS